jgi:hypothetical protein
MNGVHGVLNARFAAEGQPSFQGDLTVVTGPAAAYHDRVVVRCAHQGHLEFVEWIYAGTSEIMKTIIAREVTGLRT